MCISPVIIKNPRWNKVRYLNDRQYLAVPCGKCPECINSRRNNWSYRLNCESRYYPDYQLSFVTLTYRDDALVYGPYLQAILVKSHLQKFIKSIRNDNPDLIFKYYGIGEYGETFGRPHYHVLLFGVPNYLDFQKYWSYGTVDVGSVEPASIHYVAGYFLALDNGSNPTKPFSLMSKGIGKQHYLDYKHSYWNYALNNISVSVDNYSLPLPRYYKSLLKKEYVLPSFDCEYSVHLTGDVFHLTQNYLKKHSKTPKINYGY